MSDEQILEEEYKYFFENPQFPNTDSSDHPLYQLLINNNLPWNSGYIYSSKFECEFCKKVHKDNCPFGFKDSMTMKQVLSMI